MPQFTSYPALQARGIDMPAIRDRAQKRESQRTTDALRQTQMQVQLGQLSAQNRAQIKEKIEQAANLLAPFADPGVPEEQKVAMWPKMLSQAQQAGLPIDNVPRAFDPQYVMRKMAEADKYKNVLDQAGKMPTGYRPTEGGMELAPGYLEGQAALAAAKQAPGSAAMENIGTGGTFMISTPAGQTQVQAYFNKRQGRHFYRDAQGNEQPLPSGAQKITPSSETFAQMRPGDMLKLTAEMNDLERGTRQIYRYLGSIGKGGQGLELLTDRWVAKLKTIFGPFIKDGRLDEAQFATLIQSGQLQGLLGAFRKEIVGGGVMTEQDALRVLAALGGDLSATRNKQVAVSLLRDILTERLATYNEVFLPTYNRQGKLRSKTFKPKKRLELDRKYFAIPGDAAGPPADEPGAVLEGYLNGKPVYKRPDGTYFQTGE